MELVVLEYSGLLESPSTVVELLYCMFFERYGRDLVVPGTEYGTVTSVLDVYTYSCSTAFDCRLKTANDNFIGDFVMVNIFYT